MHNLTLEKKYSMEVFQEASEKIGLDLEDYLEILEEFMTSSISDVEKLCAGTEDNNFSFIAEAAHSLKGAAGNMSLTDIQSWAMEAEKLGKESNTSGMQQLIEKIKASISSINSLLNS